MILALIPDVIKLPSAAVLGAGLMFFPAKWIGQSEGKQMAATASLVKSVEVLRERSAIDAQVSSSDATAMCADFFLPDSEEHRECLRRLEEAGNSPSDSSVPHQERPAACERNSKPQ